MAIDAKFSVPFCTASALVNDGVNLDSFGAQQLRNPAVLALAANVRYQQPPGAEHWRGDAGTLATLGMAVASMPPWTGHAAHRIMPSATRS